MNRKFIIDETNISDNKIHPTTYLISGFKFASVSNTSSCPKSKTYISLSNSRLFVPFVLKGLTSIK